MSAARRLLVVLTATTVGIALGAVVVILRGPCLQTNICRRRPDGSCEPGPCDNLPVIPTEVLALGAAGLLIGVLVVLTGYRGKPSHDRRSRRGSGPE